MSIAIIAYGSLIWDEECLAPHIAGGWRRGRGPRLPVEFSRVSPKRKRALVLVIDESAPAPVPTSYTLSRRDDIETAARDLAARERAPLQTIGAATREGHTVNCPPAIGGIVNEWLARQPHLSGAVWTNLPGNFETEAGRPFSHQAGLEWLKSLSSDSLAEGWRYITRAPDETDTPFRRYLKTSPWWRSLDFG